MKKCGIYGIECESSNKILVGSSNHIDRRISQHFWDLQRNIHHNPHLQSAFNLYGKNNFNTIVLEICNEKDLLVKEDWWMESKNSLDRTYGYNLKPAERPLHGIETCKKISEGKMGIKNPMYGKPHSEEHRKKISKALKSLNLKRHFSKETRLKMSRSQTGKKLSEETKRKIGEASKGRIKSEETRKKSSDAQSGIKHWHWGWPIPAETRQKMSMAHKGKHHTMSEEGKRVLSMRMKEYNKKRKNENHPVKSTMGDDRQQNWLD